MHYQRNETSPESKAEILRILEAVPQEHRVQMLLEILNIINVDEDLMDPEHVRSIFQETEEKLNASTRRPVVRLPRIWAALRGRENDIISIDDFAKHFSDSVNPENDARTAISRINRFFEKFGFDIRIEHVTAYRIRRKD